MLRRSAGPASSRDVLIVRKSIALPGGVGAGSDWSARLAAHEAAQTLSKAAIAEGENERTRTAVQGWLRDLGLALGFDVWIAANDRGRLHAGMPLGADVWIGCPSRSPPRRAPTQSGAARPKSARNCSARRSAGLGNLNIAYLPYSELERSRERLRASGPE